MRALVPVLVLCAGCGIPWHEAPDRVPGAWFPHPDGFESGAEHGDAALSGPIAACLTCHVEDSTTAPTCATCHPAFPHRTGWLAGAEHGAGLIGGDLSGCLSCHGQSGLVAGDEIPCTSCHASFPHQTGWASAGVHGVYALDRDDPAATCGPCHGADLDGGSAGVACTDCHPDYPHPAGWSDPAVHGAEVGTSCFGCHGDGGEGGTSGVTCAACHATYPHPVAWDATHFQVADQVGEAVCLRCHQAGDGPATMVALCATGCHGGAP